MADNAEEKAQSQRERESAKAEKSRQTGSEAPTYPVERLIAESEDFFGQPSYVLVGALELGGVRKKNLSREEATELLDAYSKHEVTTGEEQ